jgi:cysteinyl-tRNA synthetase
MEVVQVMCVTDIDDKIIERARESQTDWRILSKVYENEFFGDLSSLNVKKPSIVSRATEFVPQMVKFIENLIEKEIAYVGTDG